MSGYPLYEGLSGYPIYMDSNLKNARANAILHYLQEGSFLDHDTEHFKVKILTYNPSARVFVSSEVSFHLNEGGRILMSNRVQPFRTEFYTNSNADSTRTALEFVLLVFLASDILNEVRAVLHGCSGICALPGRVREHFNSFGNCLDTLFIGVFVCVIYRYSIVVSVSNEFSALVTGRFDVYDDLTAPASFFRPSESGGLDAMLHFFDSADRVSNEILFFMNMNGLALILTIVRMLKYLDFQKRLGIVTRTISSASVDLFHWAILFCTVLWGFTTFGLVTFGSTIQGFSSFQRGVNTCFDILMGELSVVPQLFGHANSASAYMFYYSYVMIVFFILLNVLLAILVDAYVQVKDDAQFSKTVPEEMAQIAKASWRSMRQHRLDKDAYMGDAAVLEVLEMLEEWSKFRDDRHKVEGGIFETEGFETHHDGLAGVIEGQLSNVNRVARIPAFNGSGELHQNVADLEKTKGGKVAVGLRRISKAVCSMQKANKLHLDSDAIRDLSRKMARNIIHRYGSTEELMSEGESAKITKPHRVIPVTGVGEPIKEDVVNPSSKV